MQQTANTYDYIIAGAGSAGCAVAFRLSQLTTGTICVVEAGGTDADLRVRIPLALVNLMGSRKDWAHLSAPQEHSNNRRIKIPRGKMLGGSGSINSMVWFRGRNEDYAAWQSPEWTAAKTTTAFVEIEKHTEPNRLPDPHPLSEAFGQVFAANNPHHPPTPDRDSAGVFHTNMRASRRWSGADAFLRPAQKTGRVTVLTNAETDHILWAGTTAVGIRLRDGRSLSAQNGVILSAGAIQSPMILMRSGIGPAKQLHQHHIPIKIDAADVGANLHDHPATGLHFQGPNSGYGLTLNQLPNWAMAPFRYALTGRGPLASNTVEAGAFFRANGGSGTPDVQTHFIPFMLGWKGRRITTGSGYFADVCVCRPKSRGRLSLGTTTFNPIIDFNLLSNPHDLTTLYNGVLRLRDLLASAPFGKRRAEEAFPNLHGDALRDHIQASVATAYHPVGTCAIGRVLNDDLSVKGTQNLFVADASVMPSITSANTNAPSMMIGWRGAELIANSTTKKAAA